jgi:hypothetical protein
MTCPRCRADFDSPAGICPECGVSILQNVSGVMKTSTVLISVGDEEGSYRSVQEMPERLRRQLIETTHSANSGTILIADRAGKEQITQVVARTEAQEKKLVPAQPSSGFQSRLASLRWPVWAGIALFLCALALIAFVFNIHW